MPRALYSPQEAAPITEPSALNTGMTLGLLFSISAFREHWAVLWGSGLSSPTPRMPIPRSRQSPWPQQRHMRRDEIFPKPLKESSSESHYFIVFPTSTLSKFQYLTCSSRICLHGYPARSLQRQNAIEKHRHSRPIAIPHRRKPLPCEGSASHYQCNRIDQRMELRQLKCVPIQLSGRTY